MIKVTRTCYLGQYQPTTASTPGFWQYRTVSLTSGYNNQSGVNMGGLSNLAEYVPLFDQFKLSAYKIVLRPNQVDYNQPMNASSLTGVLPYVHVVHDPMTATIPSGTYSAATVNQFLEQGNVRTYRGDRKVTIYVKRPKVREEYGTGAIRYISPTWTTLDNSFGQAMEHRGFHLMHSSQNLAAAFPAYDVFVTYYLRFRGMK